MISPTEVVKRVGVGGRLVAFAKAVGVYFLLAEQPPAPAAVAAKCAPVLCLLLLVTLPPPRPRPPPQARYARRVGVGLALSALGDALLVWPQHFVAGMAAFALAHVAYLSAFGWRPRAPLVALACYGATAHYLTLLAPPAAGGLRALVPLYGALLATMAWRALASARRGRGPLSAAAGALLFLLSDAVLGYGLFGGGPVPHGQALVMSTYYVGQLGIALSALDPHVRAR